jgi:hypothetical protein
VTGPPERNVARSQQFERDAADIDADVRRMDDALRYVEGLLARQPTAGIESRRQPGIWVAPVVFSVAGQTVTADIAYTFNAELVELLEMRRVP